MVRVSTFEPKTKKGWSTRAKLLASARDVFSRKGYIGTRMIDIVDESGVSLGVFYRYFKNKDDVFQAVINQLDE